MRLIGNERPKMATGDPYGLRVVVNVGGRDRFCVRYLAAQGESGRDDLSIAALEAARDSLARRGNVSSAVISKLTDENRIAPGFLRALWLITVDLGAEKRRLYVRSGHRVHDLVIAARDGVLGKLSGSAVGWAMELLTTPERSGSLWTPTTV